MENEGPDSPGGDSEAPPSFIYIKIGNCENVKTTYPVAELVIKIEYLEENLGESGKYHVAKKECVPIDFEINIPCDFSSPVVVDKYISNPIVITVIETPKEVDMQNIEILSASKEREVNVKEKIESKISATETTSSGKKVKKSSKNKMKEPTSKGSQGSKDSKAKLKSKDTKTKKELKDAVADVIPEVQGPKILGVAQLDLLPIFLGKTDFMETLLLQQVPSYFDDRTIAIKNLPRLEVFVRTEGVLLDCKDAFVLNVSFESIYNIPNLMDTDYRYQICMMMPTSNSTFEPIIFKEGKYKMEKNVDNFKFWPSECPNYFACRTKYMINEDLTNIKNKINVDLQQAVFSEKPRIEWNVLRRLYLTSERKEYFYKQIKKYRKLPFEIYITPCKELEPEIELKPNISEKGGKKKEKDIKGKNSSETSKSKKEETTPTDTDEVPTEYLHLIGLADIGGLLYPGVQNCRVTCSLNTYHEYEVMELAGQDDSYFRPKPPPPSAAVDTVQSKPAKGKGKEKKEKKVSKTSKTSKTTGSSDKGKKKKKDSEEIVSVDLAKYLPPPLPPRPEPSKKIYADDGAITFFIVEFELTKPLHRKRDLEDLSKSLNNIIKKAPSMPDRLECAKLAEEVYNETIFSIAKDINTQYHKYLNDKEKCNCENVQTFVNYLETSKVYPTYLTSLIRAITLLLHEQYSFDAETIKTSTSYQNFISEVHTSLVQRMDIVLNERIRFNINKIPRDLKTGADALLFYAKEVMELGAPKIAERYYLQRICYDDKNANYWFDYAVFHMELNNVDKTIECLKEALNIEPLHKCSLLMYGLLLAGDGMLAEAETCLLTVTVSYPRWVEGWGGLHIFYMEKKNEEGVDLTFEMAKKYNNNESGTVQDYFSITDDLAWSTQDCDNNIYLRTAALFIKMRLFYFAEKTLACTLLTHAGRCEYLLGVIAYYRQEFSHALEHLWEAKNFIGADYGISGLIGHSLMKLKCAKEALTHYMKVMEMYDRPEDIHLIYLYAAICFDEQEDSQFARKLVLLACKTTPTPQTWLHAGGYYFKQNDLLSAEECLNQANLCDNKLPEVWGLLALVNSCLKRQHESDMCYIQVRKFCLNDKDLWDKIEKSRTDMYQYLLKENKLY